MPFQIKKYVDKYTKVWYYNFKAVAEQRITS